MTGIHQAKLPFPLAGEAASLGAAILWAISIVILTRFAMGMSSKALSLFKNLVAMLCSLLVIVK